MFNVEKFESLFKNLINKDQLNLKIASANLSKAFIYI